ncbi:hypothetical protein GCM10010441_62990 [Kitasatospora paracochleata]
MALSDAVSAAMTARKQGSRVEVLSAAAASSRTWANPDGTLTTTRTAEPTRVLRDTKWVDLDPTLVRTGEGAWSTTATTVPLTLSGGGKAPLVRIGSGDSALAMSWPGSLPAPTVSGATATYPSVLPDVDLKVTANKQGGFSQVFVVRTAAAARNPRLTALHLDVVASGLTVGADAAGNLSAKDVSGKVRFHAVAPGMWDAGQAVGSSTAVSGHPGARGAKHAAVGVSVSKTGLDLVPDQKLLTAADTRFPVSIDPSWQPDLQDAATTHTLNLMQGYGSSYDAAAPVLDVGNTGWFGIGRGFLQLNTAPFAGAHIISASLTMNESTAASSSPTTVQVWDTTGFTSATTWSSQPTQNDLVSGTSVAASPNEDAPASNNYATHQNFSLDVTRAIAGAAAASAPAWTIGLTASDETNSQLWKEFITPELTVTYNSIPAAPANRTLSPEAVTRGQFYTSSSTPALSATVTDPDGGLVGAKFEVWSGSSPTPTTRVASGSGADVSSGVAATWTTPALADGTYEWRAQANDGLDVGPWSGWQIFTVDTTGTRVQAPSVGSTTFPSGAWTTDPNTAGSITVSPAAPANTSAVVWQLDGSSATTVNTSGAPVSVPLAPGAGLHTFTAATLNSAGAPSNTATYTFGIGAAGVSSPADKAQTATTFTLAATAPSGAANARFQYRTGTTGSFVDVPTGDVHPLGSPTASVSWPVNTTVVTGGVSTAQYTWNAARTLPLDGSLQIQAAFTDAAGKALASTPVTVTLNRLSGDYGTTQVGPITVGLQTGNAALSATDVSIASYRSGLGVTRTFNSINPAAPSIFGPGWVSGLPVLGTSSSWSSLTDNGSYALLTAADGTTTVFTAGTTTGGVTAYSGQGSAAAAALTLTKNSSGFTLVDANGTRTVLTAPDASRPSQFVPATVTQASTGRSTAYTYAGGKPVLVTAPDPLTPDLAATQAACPYPVSAATWSAGCRALLLGYDSVTGNVNQVSLVAVDGGTFTQTPVAAYRYDASGRLTGEWDPRVSPNLVTGYTYDSLGRIASVSPAQSAGSNALQPWTITYDTTTGDADFGKVTAVTRTHSTGAAAKTTIVYRVPVGRAAGGPLDMSSSAVAQWGQADLPTSAVAVFPATHVPASPVGNSDWHYAHLMYYDANGRQTNDATYAVNNSAAGWDVSTTEYDAYGNVVRQLTPGNRETALTDPNMTGLGSVALSRQLDTENIYSSDGAQLLDTYSPAHSAMAAGTVQTVRTHTHSVYNEGAPAAGGPYHLVTTQTTSASLGTNVPGTSDVDARATSNRYSNGTDTSGWALGTPLQTVVDPAGAAITKTVVFNSDPNLYNGEPLKIEARQPAGASGGTAGDTVTIYYTAGANPLDASCGNQPNWADLTCKTKPAAQPGTAGMPNLPVTQYTYNVFLQPVTITLSNGTVTRTTTIGYDNAGRPVQNSITSVGDSSVAVPPTVRVYSASTGAVTDEESVDTNNAVIVDIRTGYDDFGQVTSYTDAAGAQTTYTYNVDGTVAGRTDPHESLSYSYEGTSGRLTRISESAGGASIYGYYNFDGQLDHQQYSGNQLKGNVTVSGQYTYDATGTATKVVYRDSHWTTSVADSIVPNAQGDWMSRSVLNSSQSYRYDAADRLAGVADTVAGQCTTRAYTYDADSNRLTAGSAAPATNGSCQTANAVTQTNTFDAADRITNSGYGYDQLGRVSTTPSADVVGAGDLTATYYTNDMAASQTQNGRTLTMTLDPLGSRVRAQSDSITGATTTEHYGDSSDSPTWSVTGSGAWSESLVGTSGQLAATVTGDGVVFQLANLHGDIMATVAADVPAAADTGPTGTYLYAEFGAVESGTPGGYGWLGATGRGTALGGTVLMGARVYNPQTGRFLQTDPVFQGSANPYEYAAQNPVTKSDTSGCSVCQWYRINTQWTNPTNWFYVPLVDVLSSGLLATGRIFTAGFYISATMMRIRYLIYTDELDCGAHYIRVRGQQWVQARVTLAWGARWTVGNITTNWGRNGNSDFAIASYWWW